MMTVKTTGSLSEETPLLVDALDEQPANLLASADLHSKDRDAANQSVGVLRAFLIILSLWMLIFLQASNMSGLTTTQSDIASDLPDADGLAQWFSSAYLIAMSSIAPLAGRLSQLFSPRYCILMSAVLFSTGGFVTSRATSFALFIIGRVISGMGGAGILTLSIILVLELTGKKKRGLFIGLLNAGYTSGVALGAVIAGAALPVFGWRALFGIQAPLGVLAGTGVFFAIPYTFTSSGGANTASLADKLKSIDYLGALSLTSTIVLFLLGLSSPRIQYLPITVSILTLAAFVAVELKVARHPIIPVTVLGSRGALLTCLAQLAFMAARWTVLFFTPVFALAIKSFVPAVAGTILIPTNLGFAVGGLLAGWLHIKRAGSFYTAALISFASFAITLLVLSQIATQHTAMPWIILVVFVNGMTTGAGLNYTLAHILHLSPPSTHFIVSSLLATFRGFAGSFGSAIGGGIFQRLLSKNLELGFEDIGLGRSEARQLVSRLAGQPMLVRTLPDAQRLVAIESYESAIEGLFAVAAATAVLALIVQACAGWKAGVERNVVLDETTSGEE